jgi:uncharacterized protein (DUF697 family)
VRHNRAALAPKGPILVTGVLAEQLAAQLRAGADPTNAASLVRTQGDPAHAAALVCVLGGAATPADEERLRAAARALVPAVCVQTGSWDAEIPYVLATDVVDVPPGQGFPVEEIARTLAAALGSDGASIAGPLPVLRDAVHSRRVADGALAAGAIALGRGGPRMPLLALAQARLLSDVAATGGRAAPDTPRATAEAVAPPLVAALATGLLARTIVRRLPVRNRLLDGAVAAAATYALATVFGRVARR